jgi:hypothetical protein
MDCPSSHFLLKVALASIASNRLGRLETINVNRLDSQVDPLRIYMYTTPWEDLILASLSRASHQPQRVWLPSEPLLPPRIQLYSTAVDPRRPPFILLIPHFCSRSAAS